MTRTEQKKKCPRRESVPGDHSGCIPGVICLPAQEVREMELDEMDRDNRRAAARRPRRAAWMSKKVPAGKPVPEYEALVASRPLKPPGRK